MRRIILLLPLVVCFGRPARAQVTLDLRAIDALPSLPPAAPTRSRRAGTPARHARRPPPGRPSSLVATGSAASG
ncbi:MAG: hypothetical protein ACREFY_08790, partial [Acetobacteraceae bacterium]